MASQNTSKSNQPCPACQNGMVLVGGVAQVCPMCDGSSKAYVPGLFYTYSILITLTSGQTQNQAINILNAPFKWIFSTSVQTGPFTIQLSDAKNQRQFFNQPLHNSLVFGTAQNPFPILNPWTFDQNGSIQINITDLSSAPNSVWLAFIGVQLVQSASQ